VGLTRTPVFRELAHAEIHDLLSRHNVGRIAFTFRDRVDIEPIHYVYDDGWIYMRTGAGSKLATLAHHPWVAFEVDEVEGVFDWRSVVVHGTVYALTPEGTDEHRHAYNRAVELLRDLIPETFTSADPVPFRTVVLRLNTDEAAGRASSSAHERR